MSDDDITKLVVKLTQSLATKDDLKKIQTNLKNFATKKDLANFATKDDLKDFATKEDLKQLEEKVANGFDKINRKMDVGFHELNSKADATLTLADSLEIEHVPVIAHQLKKQN